MEKAKAKSGVFCGSSTRRLPSWCLPDQVRGVAVLAGRAIFVPFRARRHRFATVSHGHSRSSDLRPPYYRCPAVRMRQPLVSVLLPDPACLSFL